MRWTHHVECEEARLEERMWEILGAEDARHAVGRLDRSVRSGLVLFAGGVPVAASFV